MLALPMELLSAEGDTYDGVLVDAGTLQVDREQFSERLQLSLEVSEDHHSVLVCCALLDLPQCLVWDFAAHLSGIAI